jgi:hypothetical protein
MERILLLRLGIVQAARRSQPFTPSLTLPLCEGGGNGRQRRIHPYYVDGLLGILCAMCVTP